MYSVCYLSSHSIFAPHLPVLSELTLLPSNLIDQLRLLLCLHQDVTSNLLVVLTPSLLAIRGENIH